MKLEVAMLVGPEAKQFLHDLTKAIERMEKLQARVASVVQVEVDSDDEEEDEDFEAKPAKKSKKATADFDDDEEEAAEEVEAEDDEEPVKVKKKAKKVTSDDVNDACKAKARSIGGEAGRAAVLKILKKNFKTESVAKLTPEQYEECIELMEV